MGNAQAASRSQFDLLCRRFSDRELQRLKKLFVSLAAQSRSDGEFVIASVFQVYFGIHGSLGSRLFDLATQLRKDQRLTYEDFITAKARYEKGAPDEIEQFMYQLLDLNGDGTVESEELEAVVLSILETVLGPSEAIPGATLPEASLRSFVSSVDWSDDAGKQCMSLQAFRRWCALVPSAKKFLGNILHPPGSDIPGRRVPQLLVPPKMESDDIVLRREHAWHICGRLQPQECENWILLYHSSVNGSSFNTFMSNVSAANGCTILIVKDAQGCIYGGYASQPWEKHSEFYGDMKSFLFTLHPHAAIFRASGSNSNLQWCAINYTSENIPNGLGFGGQVNHYGLFLSSSFDRGQTQASVTFNNPALSSSTSFVPDVIECWGVVTAGEDEQEQKGVTVLKGTVLERFKEERNMLNLVGIAGASS